MRILIALLLLSLPLAAAAQEEPAADGPTPQPGAVGTMSELMVKVIYPVSDAILYISTRTPTNEQEWNVLQGQALMLAESANLLMMPDRAYDQDRWMRDAQLMLDAGTKAFDAAMKEDVDALADLNDAVYQSCVVCHKHYRPDYGKPPSSN